MESIELYSFIRENLLIWCGNIIIIYFHNINMKIDLSIFGSQHIVDALKKLEAGEKPLGYRDSTDYDVVWQGKRYAPKQVIALAIMKVTGRLPIPSMFKGGEDTPIFNKLRNLGFEISNKSISDRTIFQQNNHEIGTDRNYWWVSHNATHKEEVGGGYIWSPKKNAKGGNVTSYENMLKINIGDIILSYSGTKISAVGIARSTAESHKKPEEFGNKGDNWSKNDGWIVFTDFTRLSNTVSPINNFDILRDLLPSKHSPLNKHGKGVQAYLFKINEKLFRQIDILSVGDISKKIPFSTPDDRSESDKKEEKNIQGRTDISPGQKWRLMKARKGQGVFKDNLCENENTCRITGVTNVLFLHACHIKPWCKSDDIEKLHGCNGLLLSPHIHVLFDKGLISFSDEGATLVSSALDSTILSSWGIKKGALTGNFSKMQRYFISYHRENIFKI